MFNHTKEMNKYVRKIFLHSQSSFQIDRINHQIHIEKFPTAAAIQILKRKRLQNLKYTPPSETKSQEMKMLPFSKNHLTLHQQRWIRKLFHSRNKHKTILFVFLSRRRCKHTAAALHAPSCPSSNKEFIGKLLSWTMRKANDAMADGVVVLKTPTRIPTPYSNAILCHTIQHSLTPQASDSLPLINVGNQQHG